MLAEPLLDALGVDDGLLVGRAHEIATNSFVADSIVIQSPTKPLGTRNVAPTPNSTRHPLRSRSATLPERMEQISVYGHELSVISPGPPDQNPTTTCGLAASKWRYSTSLQPVENAS